MAFFPFAPVRNWQFTDARPALGWFEDRTFDFPVGVTILGGAPFHQRRRQPYGQLRPRLGRHAPLFVDGLYERPLCDRTWFPFPISSDETFVGERGHSIDGVGERFITRPQRNRSRPEKKKEDNANPPAAAATTSCNKTEAEPHYCHQHRQRFDRLLIRPTPWGLDIVRQNRAEPRDDENAKEDVVGPVRHPLLQRTTSEPNSVMRARARRHSGLSSVEEDEKEIKIKVDVRQFGPDEITVKTVDNCVVVKGEHDEEKVEGTSGPRRHGYVKRSFVRRYLLPDGVDPCAVTSSLSSDGVLTVRAPKNAGKAIENGSKEDKLVDEVLSIVDGSETGEKVMGKVVDNHDDKEEEMPEKNKQVADVFQGQAVSEVPAEVEP